MGIFGAFGWPHLIVLLVIILLLFGAPRLPALARSVGQSMKIFRNEIKNPDIDTAAADTNSANPSGADSSDEAANPASAKTKSQK
jgi:sec-independent protein translocase protein TatA